MAKKTRYLILVLGFIFFVLFAPVMVIYVTGLKYDLKTRQFVSTGILAIRSTPSSVNILLNGKNIRKSDGDVKFLLPGEYNLSLQKNGYQPWSKRFIVRQNEVTWANPAPNNLFLFKQNTLPLPIAENVSDAALAGGSVLYLSPAGLTITSANNYNKSQTFPLKNPAAKILTSNSGQLFALDNSAVFDAGGQKIFNLTGLLTASSTLEFSDDNNLYALDQKNIYKIDAAGNKKISLLKGASAFSVLQNNLYYLNETATGSTLMISPLSGGQPQILLSNLPTFLAGKIFVNSQKQILLLLDGSLYQAANIPVLISNNISDFNFDQTDSNLLVMRYGELDSYNYFTQSLDFITRTGLPMTNFILRQDLGYTFFFKNSSLEALELDLRDRQNEYSFYQATTPQKFLLDGAGKNLYILDGGKLMEQNIR